ncbi:MAG: hypothetical protein WAT79_04695 [Saprospiraceae bacterium]
MGEFAFENTSPDEDDCHAIGNCPHVVYSLYKFGRNIPIWAIDLELKFATNSPAELLLRTNTQTTHPDI